MINISADQRLGREPVYPRKETRSDYNEILTHAQAGLTKRELFAAMAMQGFLANPEWADNLNVVASSVGYADALLKELAK